MGFRFCLNVQQEAVPSRRLIGWTGQPNANQCAFSQVGFLLCWATTPTRTHKPTAQPARIMRMLHGPPNSARRTRVGEHSKREMRSKWHCQGVPQGSFLQRLPGRSGWRSRLTPPTAIAEEGPTTQTSNTRRSISTMFPSLPNHFYCKM